MPLPWFACLFISLQYRIGGDIQCSSWVSADVLEPNWPIHWRFALSCRYQSAIKVIQEMPVSTIETIVFVQNSFRWYRGHKGLEVDRKLKGYNWRPQLFHIVHVAFWSVTIGHSVQKKRMNASRICFSTILWRSSFSSWYGSFSYHTNVTCAFRSVAPLNLSFLFLWRTSNSTGINRAGIIEGVPKSVVSFAGCSLLIFGHSFLVSHFQSLTFPDYIQTEINDERWRHRNISSYFY